MTEERALEILHEEFPEYEFEIPDTGKLDISGIIKAVPEDGFGTQTFDTHILDALDREDVSEDQARRSLVAFVAEVLEE